MTKTQNYNLNKPEATDPLRLADFNGNADIIDGALASLSADHVYVGSYVGDGTAERIIDLPFTPKVVFLFLRFGNNGAYTNAYILSDSLQFYFSSDGSIGFATGSGYELLENGLKLKSSSANYKDMANHYILFR